MPSFDIVSKVQSSEVDNAFNQAQKEIAQRFDFKDTETSIEKAPDAITIRSGSEDRAKAALLVLQDKLVKRKVSLRFTDPGKPEPTGKGGSRIVVKIKEGIEVEKARALVQTIKDAKLKVQAVHPRRRKCASPGKTRTISRWPCASFGRRTSVSNCNS